MGRDAQTARLQHYRLHKTRQGLFCGLGGRGGGLLVSVDDGRGGGMSHIWSCLETARSCFHLTQSARLDFIEKPSALRGRHRG